MLNDGGKIFAQNGRRFNQRIVIVQSVFVFLEENISEERILSTHFAPTFRKV